MKTFQCSIFKSNTNIFTQELQVLCSFLKEIYTDLEGVLEEKDEALYSEIIDETIIRTLKEHSEIYCNLVVDLANHLTRRSAIEDSIKKASSDKRKTFFACAGVLLLGSLISGCVLLATEKFDFSLALGKQPGWFISSASVAFSLILLFLIVGIHYGKLLCCRNRMNQTIWSYESDFITRYLDPLLSSDNVDEEFHQILKQIIWDKAPQIQKTLRDGREEVIRAFESRISKDVLAVIFLYAEDKLTLGKFEAEDFLSMVRQYNRPRLYQEPLYLVGPRYRT